MGYAEGDHQYGSFHHEDQDHRSSREKVLRLDRWLHLGFSLHLPGDVDLQAGVRRSRSSYCPPQMLLNNININKRNSNKNKNRNINNNRSNEKITAKFVCYRELFG